MEHQTEPTEPEFVHELLDRAAAAHGPRRAVRDGAGGWTYRELRAASRAVTAALAERGTAPGDRILCLLPGSREFVAVLYGALRRGAVLVPVAEETADFRLRQLLEDSRPSLVVASVARLEAIRALTAVPVVTAPDLLRPAPSTGDARTPPAGPAPLPRNPALLLYTSGTTARPKGIVCPHSAVVWSARAIASALRYGPEDIVYNRLPMSFDYGLYQVFLCALAGAEAVFPNGLLAAGELVTVRESGATVLPLVPTLAELLTRLAARDPRPTSLRLFTNTGAALAGPEAARLREAFPGTAIISMYGMSECKRISIATPDEDLAHPGTVGRALPGTRLFVVDGEDRPLPPGEVGQIVSAGPHVMAGYWGAPDADAERFGLAPDGTGRAVRTGDFGRLDEDGRLYFVGRRDDLFKRRGQRTSCQEVEGAMLDVPGVEAAACAPPGPDGRLTVWAVGRLAPHEVLQGVADRLGPAKRPDRCLMLERMPRTPNGKVDRAALLRIVEVVR